MKSRLAASEMCTRSKRSIPRSSWAHGYRPTTKCRCSKIQSPPNFIRWCRSLALPAERLLNDLFQRHGAARFPRQCEYRGPQFAADGVQGTLVLLPVGR
jgi:hypothetical protein